MPCLSVIDPEGKGTAAFALPRWLAAATGALGEGDFAVDIRQRQLALDRREGERALQPGDHGQQIVRNRERNVLQIVDSRSTDEYGFFQGMFRERRAAPPASMIIPDASRRLTDTDKMGYDYARIEMTLASKSGGSPRVPSLGVRAVTKLLKLVLSLANPDFEGVYSKVAKWWVEIDPAGIPQRELGFDALGEPVVAGPFGSNMGIWTASQMVFEVRECKVVPLEEFESIIFRGRSLARVPIFSSRLQGALRRCPESA